MIIEYEDNLKLVVALAKVCGQLQALAATYEDKRDCETAKVLRDAAETVSAAFDFVNDCFEDCEDDD